MNTFKEAVKELVREAFRANNAEDEKEKDEKVENEDKRKIIDEVGGILKDKVDEEVWRTIVGKLEKIAYEPSEDKKADNKAKNADEEEKEEKFEEEKEIAENKCKAKNEEKEDEDKEEKAENKCKNSMDDVRKAVFGGKSEIKSEYIPHSKRIELGNNY